MVIHSYYLVERTNSYDVSVAMSVSIRFLIMKLVNLNLVTISIISIIFYFSQNLKQQALENQNKKKLYVLIEILHIL